MGGIAAWSEGKKLKAAAEFWARGGRHEGPDAVDDLVLFGVDSEIARQWAGDDDEPEEFSVWPDNWETTQVFLAMDTQWRVVQGGNGVRIMGIDYAAAWAVINGLVPRKARPEMFAGLVTMERAALPLLNERKSEGA